MTFSLVKIPCILVATVGLHVTNTAPSPPPRDKEEFGSAGLQCVVGRPIVHLVVKVRTTADCLNKTSEPKYWNLYLPLGCLLDCSLW